MLDSQIVKEICWNFNNNWWFVNLKKCHIVK